MEQTVLLIQLEVGWNYQRRTQLAIASVDGVTKMSNLIWEGPVHFVVAARAQDKAEVDAIVEAIKQVDHVVRVVPVEWPAD